MLKKTVISFKNATNGLCTVWREERNFKIESAIALVVFTSFFFIDFSYIEMAMLTLAVGLTLSAEIANTAIEDLCDKVEPHHNPLIGKIKDTIASFVLVCALTSAIVGIIIYTKHF